MRLEVFDSYEKFKSDFHFEVHLAHPCIISSVVQAQLESVQSIKFQNAPLIFSDATSIPIQNRYASPRTLGSDRLAAAVAAAHYFPGKNVLNIDTGTCLKYNFVDKASSFLGGAISPGLTMRLKAMHQFTDGLPLVGMDAEFNTLIGTNTQSSLLSGALVSACAEVDGVIGLYQQQFPDLTVVVSGGDTDFFVKRLKNSTFARPHLVLEGLNHILEYNVKK